jgi:hypothetical protein
MATLSQTIERPQDVQNLKEQEKKTLVLRSPHMSPGPTLS